MTIITPRMIELAREANQLGIDMDDYAESSIPVGQPFDQFYRDMEARWTAMVSELHAMGTPDEWIVDNVHAPEG